MERYLPLLCVGLFLAGASGRILAHRRRHGRSGVMLFRTGGWVQGINDALLSVIVGALATQALIVAVAPQGLSTITPAGFVQAALWRWVGAALALTSMVISLIAQATLGASWRIGIEQDARPGLITAGPYRWSRSPIFLFILMTPVGFVILVPTWLSLLSVAAAWAAIRRQIHTEEEWLLKTYGDDYRAYARSVGRFLPWFGRLRDAA